MEEQASPEENTGPVKGAPTFRDVVMACMSPIVAVKRLKEMKPQASRHTMLRAANWLKNKGHKRQSEIIFRYMEKTYPRVPPEPSRVKPKPGDIRKYRTQCQKSGLFARVPVELLGVRRKEEVVVEFFPAICPGVLVVRALSAEEKRETKKIKERF